jgi:mRNA-degrading endonuclease RelE of RelBE toxin-antitoxin system
MSWKIDVKPAAEKQYLRLDSAMRRRLKEALCELESQDNPLLHPKVTALTGKLKGDYRLRVGAWRLLFTPRRETRTLFVYAILPRGRAY